LQANRDESNHIDHNKVTEDATELWQAGENSWFTDDSAFNKILATRSAAHIKELRKV